MSDILMFEKNICVSVVTTPFLRWWGKNVCLIDG